MTVELSEIGAKMNRLTGVRAIMKDIAEALRSDPSKRWINLSPGNPVILPEVSEMWRRYAKELLSTKEFDEVVGRYGMTQGYDSFLHAVVQCYKKEFGWQIEKENVLVTAGSQSLYFFLTNLLAGPSAKDGRLRKILLPVCPEYTGYDGVVLDERFITSVRPKLEILSENRFRYVIDLNSLELDDSIAAVLLSRPCNPTGNVINDEQMSSLVEITRAKDIPLIVDSAYAPPFPNLVYTQMTPVFGENVIHSVSLSKAGLPGERIGYAIAPKRYIEVIEPFESNAGIHSSRFGQALAARAIGSGDLLRASCEVIRPYYQKRLELFQHEMDKTMPRELPWYLHQAEGSLFAWLWVHHPKMNDRTMYQELKKEGLIVVPGSTFFPGLKEEWEHKQQCLRISLTASSEDLRDAASIFGKVCEGLRGGG